MKRRILMAVCMSLLTGAFAGVNRMAGVYVDEVLRRYPGAVAISADWYTFGAIREGTLTRQGVYQTGDPLAVVKRWYMVRLRIAPASDMNLNGDCVWLTESRPIIRIVRNVSALLCPGPAGTRVVVNESVSLWP